jgi:hypothetical protein
MRSRHVWLLCLIALAALVLVVTSAGNAQPVDERRPHATTFRPGDERVDGTRLGTGEWTRRMIRTADGKDTEVGRLRYAIAIVDGRLRYIQEFDSPRGPVRDTSMVEARSMQPVMHHGHGPGTEIAIAFDGARVTGTYSGDSVVAIDRTLEEAAFDASVAEPLVGALPLAIGLDARIPLYYYEGGLVWMTVLVTAKDAEGWHVDLGFAGRRTALLIDEATRRVVRSTIEMPDGSRLTVR